MRSPGGRSSLPAPSVAPSRVDACAPVSNEHGSMDPGLGATLLLGEGDGVVAGLGPVGTGVPVTAVGAPPRLIGGALLGLAVPDAQAPRARTAPSRTAKVRFVVYRPMAGGSV